MTNRSIRAVRNSLSALKGEEGIRGSINAGLLSLCAELHGHHALCAPCREAGGVLLVKHTLYSKYK